MKGKATVKPGLALAPHTSCGSPLPMGVSRTPMGYNFALFSRHTEAVSLVFFRTNAEEPVAELVLDPEFNRTGEVWHILVKDFDPSLRYGFRLHGPYDPQGEGHFFQPEQVLLDPYAKALTGGSDWGVAYRRKGRRVDPLASFQRRCLYIEDDFDWGGDRPLNIPLEESIIYELHVRGYTCHPSAGVEHPGTYRGLAEKIPYLKQLGVTAVQLLPVAEFNELENTRVNPVTGEALKNFWGYSPLAFFAPKAAYAVNGRNGNQVREFKEMVKALHAAGIEVILDVVYNHTAEGGADGPTISFRGIDNTIYYLLDPVTREYLNFSGCGNTVNCNHPWVRHVIMDCLRYWVMEMHVDGFRFDLASIMGRGMDGEVLANPPMVEKIAEDPILAKTKIIAEAWDAAGLYQVGAFSSHHRWAELNGRFRDDVRRFLCGHSSSVAPLATRIAGSSDLYAHNGRKPVNSINFITSHDGFTLHDLVSYNHKHNLANGEDDRDGDNHNISWNSGVEGETSDPAVLALRHRRTRTAAVILLLSQGVPLLLAGDEFGRSQQGNNNAYCQDNEISWLNWDLAEQNGDLLRFFRRLIALRRQYSLFRRDSFFAPDPAAGPAEISWQSLTPGQQDWSAEARVLAYQLHGGRGEPDFFFMFNAAAEPRTFSLPSPPAGRRWRQLIDTAAVSPADIIDETKAVAVRGARLQVVEFAAAVLIA
ncbi:glycogen debranching protein GlgX [Desulfurivibrio dismutans]|uniref:glycogen debranching protein GlgX n=1 Tax=Desulfurivibrio dismutans TaxID=1398908 RepID=UPI0023DA7425|nr:glycogen debranching protein GlgX [Desulfurivibrio alkaliphilus]MDF1615131.1 glycogen debranching protein GlgX [Desulfurivibrio alkaliphilus]